MRVQRMPIKAILLEAKALPHLVGSRLSPQHGWVGCGLCHYKTRPSMGFCPKLFNFYTREPGLNWIVRFDWNRPIPLGHRSDRRFRRFVTGLIFKRFNRANRTGDVTGRRLNRLDRPVRSVFKTLGITIVLHLPYKKSNQQTKRRIFSYLSPLFSPLQSIQWNPFHGLS